jgi:hypothetical protein
VLDASCGNAAPILPEVVTRYMRLQIKCIGSVGDGSRKVISKDIDIASGLTGSLNNARESFPVSR